METLHTKRLLIFGFFLAGASAFVNTQTVSSSQGSSPTPQPLLRIERLQAGEAVCALVQDDGTYRLEKLVRANGEFLTGTTSRSQVDRLNQILMDPELLKLSQQKIRTELMTDTIDGLDLAIWRDRGWQVLSFKTASSRKPFRDSLDPLLKWFQELQKEHPASTKLAGPATRCIPPQELKAESHSAETRPTQVSPDVRSGYVFQFQSSQFDRGVVHRTCMVLFIDGTYHRENRSESFDGPKTDKAYRGQVDTSSLASLKQLLDAPDLKNAVSDSGRNRPASNFEGATLTVPRENGTQRLEFVTELNALGNPKEVGGLTGLGYHVGSQKVLDPLKHWMNEHTGKQDSNSREDKTVNDCFPVKTP